MSGDAPWWFATTMAIAGVVVGAVLQALIGYLAERSRRRREDSLRWAPERMKAYAGLSQSFTSLVQASTLRAWAKSQGNKDEFAKWDAAAVDSNSAVNRAQAEVDVIGPASVAGAAKAACEQLFTIAPSLSLPLHWEDFNRAHQAFLTMARRSLPDAETGASRS